MIYIKFIVICSLICIGFSSSVPIWELLTYDEKVENLTFVLRDLVNIYCKKSTIPDCERVLAHYGVTNLLKEDESTLDLLDPHHWNTRNSLWKVSMNGAFDYVDNDLGYKSPNRRQTEVENDLNTISNSADMDYNFPNYYDYDVEVGEPHPYAVKVLPPPGFKHVSATSEKNPIPSTDKPLVKTSTYNKRQYVPNTQAEYDSRYIVLLPHGSPSSDSISGRLRIAKFQDYRQRPSFEELKNYKRYSESYKPNKPLLYTILRK